MKKFLAKYLSVALILPLITTIIAPEILVQQAKAATITKTITVRDSGGNLLPGALVQISATRPADEYLSDVVTTNSSGQAVISVPDEYNWVSLNVFPPANNTTDAFYFKDGGINLVDNENLEIQLAAANFKINPLKADGSAVLDSSSKPIRYWICAPGVDLFTQEFIQYSESGYTSQCTVPLRAGAFGINIPKASMDSSKKYAINFFTDTRASDGTIFGTPFGLKVDSSANLLAYTDNTYTTTKTASGGIYTYNIDTYNLLGTLKTSSGGAFTMPANSWINATFYKLKDNGDRDTSVRSPNASNAVVGSDGKIYGRLRGNVAGNYQILFVPDGLASANGIPSFKVDLFQNSSGQFSLTNSNFQNTPLNFEVNLPSAANQIKFALTNPSTSALSAGTVNIFNSSKSMVAFGHSSDGNFAIAKSSIYKAGIYSVSMEPGNTASLIRTSYTLTVPTDGANPVVTDSQQNAITTNSSGVYQLNFGVPNFKFKITHPTNGNFGSTNVYPYFCVWADDGNFNNCGIQSSIQDATFRGGALLANGTYAMRFNVEGDPTLVGKNYKIVVSGGAITSVQNSSGASISVGSGGVYDIPLSVSNIKFKIVNPSDQTKLLAASSMNLCTVDSDGNVGQPCYDGWASNGTVGFSIPNGIYDLNVWPNRDGLSSKRYRVTINNGSITSSSPTISSSAGFYVVTAATSNLKLQLVSPTDGTTALTQAWVDYCADDNSGCYGYGADQNGKVSLSLDNGNYTLRVHPSSGSGFAVKSYAVVVSGGTATVTGVTADSNGLFKLAAASANFTVAVKNSSGGNITFSDGTGLDVSIWKYNSEKSYWDWHQHGGWFTSGTVAVSITEAGTYKLKINPRGISGVSTTDTKDIVITSGPQVSYDGDSAASSKSVTLNLLAPNLNMKITNPTDNSLLSFGWVSIEKFIDINTGHRNWVSNADLTPSTPGLTSAALTDGDYLLTVNPPQGNQSISGVAAKQYNVQVSGTGTTLVVKTGATPRSGTTISIVDGYYPLSLNAANLNGRLLDGNGSPMKNTNNSWVNINLQKQRNDGFNWDWTNVWAQPNQDGYFSMRLDEAGTYRLRIEPNGRTDVSTTFTQPFAVTAGELATFSKNFGDVTLGAPTLKLKVRVSGNETNRNWVGIELRKDGQWFDWVNTGPNGIAAVNLTSVGNYEFIVNPPGDIAGVTRATYKAVATSSNNTISATITGETLQSDGTYILNFGQPKLGGTVLETSTVNTVANSQVVAVNTVTGQEMWEYSANTNNSGAWSMGQLPQGTYKLFARAPWGSATLANSDQVGTVTVAANGDVTLSGDAASNSQTPTTIKLRLNGPYWSGRITASDTTTNLKNARVCLFVIIGGVGNWNCGFTNNSGQWAMSKPTGFTAFDSNSRLEIASNEPTADSMKVATGATAVGALLDPNGASNLNLSLAAPNTTIRILDKDSAPVPNVWVSLDRNNYGWLGGAVTDTNGYARFNIDITSVFNIRVETSSNPNYSGIYASVFQELTSSDLTAGTSGSPAVFAKTIQLALPNIRGTVTDPSTNTTLANSWIELYDNTNNRWLGGSNTDLTGLFALNASATNVTYTLTVNPPWNSTTTSARHEYQVTVGANTSDVVIVDKVSNVTINKNSSGIYQLALAAPSVSGYVKNPAGNQAIQNSWVSGFNDSNGNWIGGSNTNANGYFGMALANGTYNIEANVPWNQGADYARSAQCKVVVSGGSVTSATGCTQAADKTVTLNLRAPNLTITLKNAAGSTIQNAYVGIALGSWSTGGQSDANGKVSLFVDKAAIKAALKRDNGGTDPTGTYSFWIWMDPPWGTSDVVRVNCSSTQANSPCSGIPSLDFSNNNDYTTTTLDAVMPAPNTKILVKKPNGTAIGRGAWVEIFQIDSYNNQQWVGGAVTDNDSYATFNLNIDTATSTARFVVRVNPPWEQRGTYSAKTYDGVSQAGLLWNQIDFTANNANIFTVADPNLKLVIKAAGGSNNKWGWVMLEKFNSDGTYNSWVGGYGLDENGNTAALVPSSGKFKLTAFPGPGKAGSATSCYINTDGSGAITSFETCTAGSNTVVNSIKQLTLTLESGNVRGKVTRTSGGANVINAIVYAYQVLDPTKTVVATTDENGNYGFDLDSTKEWKIKVIPVNLDDGSTKLSEKTTNGFTPQPNYNSSNQINITLDNL